MIKDQARVDVQVDASTEVYRGAVWAVKRDDIVVNGFAMTRDYIKHMGAVGIVAINENGEILLISQYRHAVGMTMLEIPAGLIDTIDEKPVAAAQRELREESGYSASQWHSLIDFCTTPGSSSESIRIFLAADLQEHAWNAGSLHGEEQEIVRHWMPIDDALALVYGGEINSPTAVAGILAYAGSMNRKLRPADAPWLARSIAIDTDRVFQQ